MVSAMMSQAYGFVFCPTCGRLMQLKQVKNPKGWTTFLGGDQPNGIFVPYLMVWVCTCGRELAEMEAHDTQLPEEAGYKGGADA